MLKLRLLQTFFNGLRTLRDDYVGVNNFSANKLAKRLASYSSDEMVRFLSRKPEVLRIPDDVLNLLTTANTEGYTNLQLITLRLDTKRVSVIEQAFQNKEGGPEAYSRMMAKFQETDNASYNTWMSLRPQQSASLLTPSQ